MIRLAIFLALGTAPAAFADGGFFTGRDVVFLGEPGVLEARQRIALRMRAAQHA